MWLGPNEWLLVSNDIVSKETNEYELEKVLHHIPEDLREKLYYKKIDITNYVEYAY